MQTTIESRSRTVVIGDGAPFCVIGERINPTGRKAFQAQLQAGDLSQLEIDVAEQVAGGADVLDVNVGDPLADEIELMRRAGRITAAPCLATSGRIASSRSSSPVTEFTSALPS